MLPPDSTSPTLRPLKARSVLHRRGERSGARALGEIVRVGPIGADRRGDVLVADERDARRALDDHGQRLLVGKARRHAVGAGVGAIGANHMAGGERERVSRRLRRLHADDFRFQTQRVARRDAAADARSLADRNVEHVEVRALAQELERIGRDAEREIAMEGRNRMQAARFREPHRFLARGLKVMPELDELGAERAHGGVLLARIALRREDRHLQAGAPPGEGEALAVIAARRRDEAPRLRLAPHERVDISEPAAHLEGARRLVVLVLHHDLGLKPLGEERPGKSRRRAQGPEHDLVRPAHFLKREHRIAFANSEHLVGAHPPRSSRAAAAIAAPHPSGRNAKPASCPSRRSRCRARRRRRPRARP